MVQSQHLRAQGLWKLIECAWTNSGWLPLSLNYWAAIFCPDSLPRYALKSDNCLLCPHSRVFSRHFISSIFETVPKVSWKIGLIDQNFSCLQLSRERKLWLDGLTRLVWNLTNDSVALSAFSFAGDHLDYLDSKCLPRCLVSLTSFEHSGIQISVCVSYWPFWGSHENLQLPQTSLWSCAQSLSMPWCFLLCALGSSYPERTWIASSFLLHERPSRRMAACLAHNACSTCRTLRKQGSSISSTRCPIPHSCSWCNWSASWETQLACWRTWICLGKYASWALGTRTSSNCLGLRTDYWIWMVYR